MIEGKDADGFERDGYSVRWQLENSLGLVFVVGAEWQRQLTL